MTVRGTTAEWYCTQCATTNRKLVPSDTVEVRDRCVHCKKKHIISPAQRTSWKAAPA